MNKKHVIVALAASIATASSATISVNFLRNPTTTPAANDGSEFGISTWTDFDASAGSPFSDVDGTGVDISWTAGGTWGNGDANNVVSGYIDNTSTMTITGLDTWLASVGDIAYTIQLIQGNDSNNGFQNTEIFQDNSTGTLLDTLTNANIRSGESTVSQNLSAATVFLDTTSGGAGARSGVSGIIITSVVPEPSSGALLGLVGLGLALRRKRS